MSKKKLQKQNPYRNQIIRRKKSNTKLIVCGVASGTIFLSSAIFGLTLLMQPTKPKENTFQKGISYVYGVTGKGYYLQNQIEEYNKRIQPKEEIIIEEEIPEEETIKEEIEEETIEEQSIEQPIEHTPTEEEQYIKLYSDIYSLDYNQVYELLSNMTSNFKDPSYLNNYIIGDSMMKGLFVQCTSKEEAILLIVRSLSQTPEKYGLKKGQLDTGIEYVSDLDYSHQIAYVSNVVGIDPALNYAICKTECGFTSSMFLNKHNPSGIKFSGSYASFPSSMAGFIEQALELLKYQLKGKTTIKEIGSIHAPISEPTNKGWVSSVTSIYNQANKNYSELFNLETEKVLSF